MPENTLVPDVLGEDDRRQFLLKAGRFAAVVPPAMTLLLSTTMSSEAIAASGAVAATPRGPNAGVPNTQGAPGGGGFPGGGGPGGAGPLGGASAVAGEPPVEGPGGQSLVASSPDFDPPPFVPAGGKLPPKVAAAGERG